MKAYSNKSILQNANPVLSEDNKPDGIVSRDVFDFKKMINSFSKLPKNEQKLKLPDLAFKLAHLNPLFDDDCAEYARKKGLGNKTPILKAIRTCRTAIKRQNRIISQSSTPTDIKLAERWNDEYPNTIYAKGQFKRYIEGIWFDIPIDDIKKEFTDLLEASEEQEGLYLTIGKFNSVLEFARIRIADEKGWKPDPNLLPLINGVFDLKEMRLLPHNPDYRFTYHLDYAFDRNADCPVFKKMLSRIPQWSKTIQKFAGYCTTAETKYETALWFYGSPGCGKSMILNGLQLMLGEFAGELSLSDMQYNRFYLQKSMDLRLLVSTEQPNGYITSSDKVNILISGEKIGMEKKFKNPFTTCSNAKIAWASNEPPRIRNFSNNGLSRRLLLIPMPPLPPEERDVDLHSKLKEEIPGIFNFALEGLKILRAENGFRDGVELSRTVNNHEQITDIPSLFIEERCTLGKGRIKSSVLYQEFQLFCNDKGYDCPSQKRLAEVWKELGFENKYITGCSYWYGISLKDKDS